MLKTYILLAHEAEHPYVNSKVPDNVAVRIIGIGEECTSGTLKVIKEINEAGEEVRVLLLGTCGSFTRLPGFVVYDSILGPRRYLRDRCSHRLITVDRLISEEDKEDHELNSVDGFDMESSLVKDLFEFMNSPFVEDFSVIKVVSDPGCASLEEWARSVDNIRRVLREEADHYISLDGGAISEVVKIFQDFPMRGVKFVDLFPSFSKDNLYRFHRWLSYKSVRFDLVCPESRGMLLGSSFVSSSFNKLKRIMVPARKRNKLPGSTVVATFLKEYGFDALEISKDHLNVTHKDHSKRSVVILDDILASGGTAEGLFNVLEGLILPDGSFVEVEGFYFFAELPDLGGAKRLEKFGVPVESFVKIKL